MNTDRLARIAVLNRCMGLLRYRECLARFGSEEAVLEAPAKALESMENMGPKKAATMVEAREEMDGPAEVALAWKHGARIVPFDDPAYPPLLLEIHNPPLALYVLGGLAPADGSSVGVVGTRRCSPYGRRRAGLLAGDLVERGYTVVSGMARGVDTAAHKAVLDRGGRTLAVLGSGLLEPYPRENRGLMEAIAGSGAVISEFPLRTRPHATHFPRRNRIIAGLSLGVLVVEAPYKSGALITSTYALEENREVFAVPGRVGEMNSQGPNKLIHDGAKMVLSVDDIVEELPPPLGATLSPVERGVGETAAPEEARVLAVLGDDPRTMDELACATEFPVGELASLLLQLELKGLAKQLPGKRFVKA